MGEGDRYKQVCTRVDSEGQKTQRDRKTVTLPRYVTLRYDPMIVADDCRGAMVDVRAVKDCHSYLPRQGIKSRVFGFEF